MWAVKQVEYSSASFNARPTLWNFIVDIVTVLYKAWFYGEQGVGGTGLTSIYVCMYVKVDGSE
jgi:hypothetical protein